MKDELSLLLAQITVKKRLETMLKELQAQQEHLSKKVADLEAEMNSERRDMETLEGRSLAAFFYYCLGKRDEKLDTGRRNFYAARVKYDAARRELESIETDIEATQEDLADLADCETRYAAAIDKKRSAIEEADNPQSWEFIEKEQALNTLIYREKDLEEAVSAGTGVLRIASDVLNSLRSVENLSYLDRLGHNPLTDMAKHDTLDEAQKNVEALQVALQCFNKELSDIPSRENIQDRIDRMLQFSESFFENLFMDASVPERLRQSYAQVEQVLNLTLSILRQLQSRLEEVRRGKRASQSELDAMILEIEL